MLVPMLDRIYLIGIELNYMIGYGSAGFILIGDGTNNRERDNIEIRVFVLCYTSHYHLIVMLSAVSE